MGYLQRRKIIEDPPCLSGHTKWSRREANLQTSPKISLMSLGNPRSLIWLNFDHNKWQTNSDSGTLVSEHTISYSALPVIGILLFFTYYFLSKRSGRTACPVYNTSGARRSHSRPWIPPAMQTTLNYALHATQNIVRNTPPPLWIACSWGRTNWPHPKPH
jgi:hypothetical protein